MVVHVTEQLENYATNNYLEPEDVLPTTVDNVNSPNHYQAGRIETIEMIEDITKGYSDGYVAYCVGNTIKYLSRAPYKHKTPKEDLLKAMKYLEFAIKKIEEDTLPKPEK